MEVRSPRPDETEEQQVFLLRLSDILRPLSDPVEIQTTASWLLGEHFKAAHTYYYEFNEATGTGVVASDHVRNGARSLAGVYQYEDFCYAHDTLRTGQPLVLDEIQRSSQLSTKERTNFEALQIRSIVCAPLNKDGKLVAVLNVADTKPHHWSPGEIELLREVGERTWAAVERARVEAALRESETRLRLSLEASSTGTFFWYPEEDRTEPDLRMLTLFGLKEDSELTLAAALATLLHPDDRSRYAEAVARARDPHGNRRLREDVRFCWADGSEHWIALNAEVHFDGDPPRAVRMAGTAMDITERKLAEAALAQASSESARWRQLYEAVLANTPDLGYVFGLNHRFTYANDALLAMWGKSWDEAIGKNCLELGYPPWHAAMHDREIDQVIATHQPVRGEVPFDGTHGRRVYDYIFFPVFSDDGHVEAVAGTTRDITDIRTAETALNESEERFRLFVHNVREYAFVQTDTQYRITSWNPGAERLFGYSSREAVGRHFALLLTPEDNDAGILAAERARIEHGERHEDARWFVRKNGTRLWTRWVTEPIRNENGALLGLAKVLRDETERLNTETSLRQSEKLAVVGRLASSIAHEINNPLAAVVNLVYLAQTTTNSPETLEFLEQAQRELSRVTHITTETLRFHRQATEAESVDLAEIVEAVLLLHEGRLSSAQIITERRYRKHPNVICHPNEIRQVLANLISNAIDAMNNRPDPRQLIVRINADADLRSLNSSSEARGVRITIADTGSGISRAARKRIFEPFFTTKETTGTGLGLWVSSEIVRKQGGSLRFRSRQSPSCSGTVFTLFLRERATE